MRGHFGLLGPYLSSFSPTVLYYPDHPDPQFFRHRNGA
jgi:hypothetical protein